jgi:nucleoid DNA-binding protein
MNKQEIATLIQKEADLDSRKAGEDAYEIILETIRDTLGKGESVSVRGFGTFQVVNRKARTGRNPQTGESIKIPATRSVKFTPGKELREAAQAGLIGQAWEWIKNKQYLRGAENQLKDLGARMEKLGRKAGDSSLYKESADKLGHLYDEAAKGLKELKNANYSHAWSEIRKGFDSAFASLKDGLHKAWSKF